MPAPRDPVGLEFAKTVWRQQYENHVASEVTTLLRGTWSRVYAEMHQPRWAQTTRFTREQQTRLFIEINNIINAGYQQVNTFTAAELVDYAAVEQQIAARTLEVAITDAGGVLSANATRMLSQQMITSIAELPIQGLKLGEWWSHMSTNMGVMMRRTLQQGLLEGLGPHAIARNLFGVHGDGAVAMRSMREARAMARTATAAVQNHAATETYKRAGTNVTPGYTWLSARDNRVTPICRGLDGKTFAYDDPKAPLPPAHFQCRSTTIPELNWKALGIRKPGERHDLGFKSYASWLRGQTRADQDAILGRAAANVWRSGRVDLIDLVNKDGRKLTVTQLARKFGTEATQ